MGKDNSKKQRQLEKVVVRFAGDSGDGMQLVGTEFGRAVAIAGNGISTLPDYPAEIRAPAGTIGGVSGFQIQFASYEVFTPGDVPDVLVAMNPAALKVNIGEVRTGGTLIINEATFTKSNLLKAGYENNPLEDETLSTFNMISTDMTKLVQKSLENTGLSTREMARSKNFWALGLMYWMFSQPLQRQVESIRKKFKNKPVVSGANILAFEAGNAFGENTEQIQDRFVIKKANLKTGSYRSVTGNSAIALGLAAAGKKSGLPFFLGSYPITPASDILHSMSSMQRFGVTTFQAEDEISAIGAAIGASYGGSLAAVTTSGPGLALKTEALGLALMLELPLVVIDVQRGGPSTGMPTKSEQGDLLMAMYGRNGESPLPIIAPKSPSDCFAAAFEACKIAIKYMTPVILLSDSFIANSAEPWRIVDPELLPSIDVKFEKESAGFSPYKRDEQTLARPWVVPGTPGLEHRIGGLEKDQLTGEVSHDLHNHEKMIALRAAKVQKVQESIENTGWDMGGADEGDLLLVGWGSSFGSLRRVTKNLCAKGAKIGHLNPRWLFPFPKALGEVLGKYKKILVCESNSGQLHKLLRAEYMIPMEKFTKIRGKPFSKLEIKQAIEKTLANDRRSEV